MFDILIGFACILLAALLLGILAGDYSRLQRAYSCCGLLSMLGGTGLVLTAFLTSLSPSYAGIPFSIGIALCFFFLVSVPGRTHSACSRVTSPRRSILTQVQIPVRRQDPPFAAAMNRPFRKQKEPAGTGPCYENGSIRFYTVCAANAQTCLNGSILSLFLIWVLSP